LRKDLPAHDQFQIPAQQNQHLDYLQNDLQIRQALKIRDAHNLETQRSLLPPLFTIDAQDIAAFEKFIIKGNKILPIEFYLNMSSQSF
jgi:hypothetical protein